VRREESTQSGADALSSLKDERKVRSRLFPPGGARNIKYRQAKRMEDRSAINSPCIASSDHRFL